MSICGSSREALYFSGKIPIIKPLEMYIPEIRQMDTPKSLFFRCVVYLFYINICLCNIYIYMYIYVYVIYIYILYVMYIIVTFFQTIIFAGLFFLRRPTCLHGFQEVSDN